MKVRAILEFDLENEDGGPIEDRREYAWAAEAADSAIRTRLMGSGFLHDALIGTYQVNVGIFDGTMDEIDAESLMNARGGAWGEHPDYPVASWMYEVANGDTRSGYWNWVAARSESA
jgi:hypothetical protein